MRNFSSKYKEYLAIFERFLRLRCLQHGDSWHNNFVFHKARDVVRVAIVDWQVSNTFSLATHKSYRLHACRFDFRGQHVYFYFYTQVSYYGSGPSDLSYLLYSSTTSNFRRSNQDRLAEIYYDTFVKTADSLLNREDGWRPPSHEEFFRELRKVSCDILLPRHY